MEWKKPFALFAGSFGFFLSLALYCFGVLMIGNPHMAQDCVYVTNWNCNIFDKLVCTYLEDFQYFGYDSIKSALTVTGLFYMILNGLLLDGLIKPEFIYRYQRGNTLSTIALMSTLVYVSYLIKLHSC